MARPENRAALAGSARIFRVFGISVFVHWTWLLVAYVELQSRVNTYNSALWNVIEYLSLFVIVLLHEFGHALACRQVGGQADQIVLWPLGGIAFVRPPRRPGAVLWSIAAGPLVNVILVPITVGAYVAAGLPAWRDAIDVDVHHFLFALSTMNLILLVFNLLPIYPLDGGQILQALLWFVIGQAKSLLVVSVIGMVVGVGVLIVAVLEREMWFGILAAFVAFRSLAGFQMARQLARLASVPTHKDAACPSCHEHPLAGDLWKCDLCQTAFDTFTHRGICPGCGKRFDVTSCPACGQAAPIATWYGETEDWTAPADYKP